MSIASWVSRAGGSLPRRSPLRAGRAGRDAAGSRGWCGRWPGGGEVRCRVRGGPAARRGARRHRRGGLAVALPERETELRRLRAAIGAAGAGEGSVTVVTGQLGVGKTALLKEVLRSAEADPGGPRVLTAAARRTEQDFDFGIACQVLEPLVAEADAGAAERWFAGTAGAARWLFPGAPGWPGWEPGDHNDVLTTHGLLGLLAAISADRPLAVLVDDLHLADRQSLTWLRHCARRIHDLPCALVVAVREGDPGADRPAIRELWELAKTRIRPGNLSEDGVGAVLRAASDG